MLAMPIGALVAGVDEAGRGPLAGPVVAAAVVLPRGFDPTGLDDSKQLTPTQRKEAEVRIQAEAEWSVAFVGHETIDRINILQATMMAMRSALAGLPRTPSEAWIDGDRIPGDLPCPARCFVRGDGSQACIAAASILAKCARDRHMAEMAELYPGYGFERNFGYAAPEHLTGIEIHGPCPIHRLSFSPFRSEAQLCLIEGV